MAERKTSKWRDKDVWQERLKNDEALIEERLTVEQEKVLREAPRMVGEIFPVQFVLVVGSRARGNHREESDLDLYIEAEGAPNDPKKAPAVTSEHFDVLIVPAGVLVWNVRGGDDWARKYALEGLVASDNGSFREALIRLEEEGLLDSSAS